MKTITNQSANELVTWLEDYKTKLSGPEMKVLNEKRKINKVIKKISDDNKLVRGKNSLHENK